MSKIQISNNIPLQIMYDGIEKDFKQQKTILLIKNNNANTPEATLLFIVVLLSGNVILNVPINVQHNEKPPNIETIKLDSVIAHQLKNANAISPDIANAIVAKTKFIFILYKILLNNWRWRRHK